MQVSVVHIKGEEVRPECIGNDLQRYCSSRCESLSTNEGSCSVNRRARGRIKRILVTRNTLDQRVTYFGMNFAEGCGQAAMKRDAVQARTVRRVIIIVFNWISWRSRFATGCSAYYPHLLPVPTNPEAPIPSVLTLESFLGILRRWSQASMLVVVKFPHQCRLPALNAQRSVVSSVDPTTRRMVFPQHTGYKPRRCENLTTHSISFRRARALETHPGS